MGIPFGEPQYQYAMYGLTEKNSAFSNTSPTRQVKLPGKGPWSFMTASGTDLYKLLANSNPKWYDNLLALQAQLEPLWLPYVEANLIGSMGGSRVGLTSLSESSRQTVSVPDFKRRRAEGEIFNNPYSHTRLSISSAAVQGALVQSVRRMSAFKLERENKTDNSNYWISVASWQVKQTQASLAMPMEFAPELTKHLTMLDAGSQSAINSAFGNMQEGEVELLSMAVEGRETLSHLLSVIVRFTRLVSALRRGDISKIAPKTFKKWRQGSFDGVGASKKMFEDAWLEARYAWVPLVMDAVGLANIVTGNVSQRDTYRAKRTDQEIRSLDFPVVTSSGTMQFVGTCTTMASARAGVLTERVISSPLAQQFGIFNIATALKEAIPFSFVLEWFVNLSGLLYHLNPNPMLRPLSAWCTQKSESSFNGTLSWTPTSSQTLSIPITGTFEQKVRDPVGEPGLITIDANLGISRFIDGAIFSLRALR